MIVQLQNVHLLILKLIVDAQWNVIIHSVKLYVKNANAHLNLVFVKKHYKHQNYWMTDQIFNFYVMK